MSSTSSNTQEGSSRFSDFLSNPDQILPPIQGFENQPPVPLEKAIERIESEVPQVKHMVWTVKNSCKKPRDGLSQDESAAIMLYTLEWQPRETSFYFKLNSVLRLKERHKLTPWFLYLRLFVHALSKLEPITPRVIYRGVKLNLSEQHPVGDEFIWWSFSSCTSTIGVLENHIGKTGDRTIFNISCSSAIDISRHSYYQAENELILFPARQFKVTSSLNTGNGLHIVELQETEPPFSLFQMPKFEKSNKTSSNIDQCINILLIGEKGVGKSTFINSFVNYLTFNTIDQAERNQPVTLKPLSYVMMTPYECEEKIIRFGDVEHFNSSTNRSCQTYTFNLNQSNGKQLCFIDTPSFDEIEDLDRNISTKIQIILNYINKLTHINGICFLVKPDASYLLNGFQLCFAQLLNRLGRNFYNNIIFCFTNALTNFYTPGNTAVLLRRMFASHSLHHFPFSKTNTFFFDNEAFRYLIAVKNRIKFSREDKEEYSATWGESVHESNRLLNHIQTSLTRFQMPKN